MKKFLLSHKISALAVLVLLGWTPVHAGAGTATAQVPTRMTVTLQVQGENKRMPEVTSDDVIVKQGNDRLSVNGWTPARGDRAGLDLFILIDERSENAQQSHPGKQSAGTSVRQSFRRRKRTAGEKGG